MDNVSSKNPPLIILTGPTASGKTGLSISLAKRIDAEIISADSMQVYKKLDIGSAKIRSEEMCGIKHYLIDEYEFDFDFNVVEFQRRAKEAINEIYNKGKIPLIVGGTGFYIQSVLKDIDFTETTGDTDYRESLYKLARDEGSEAVFDILKDIDPESAKTIHPNNVKRVVRAIEFAKFTGNRISVHNDNEKKKESPYNFAYFVMSMNRDRLYNRIDYRVDKMLEEGLLSEVVSLKNEGAKRDMISMQGLGYKELLAYLDDDISLPKDYNKSSMDPYLDEAVRLIKRNTRHFAKRQMTWFRRENDVIYLDADKYSNDEMHDNIIDILKDKNILENK